MRNFSVLFFIKKFLCDDSLMRFKTSLYTIPEKLEIHIGAKCIYKVEFASF